jgi:hypothetical protein
MARGESGQWNNDFVRMMAAIAIFIVLVLGGAAAIFAMRGNDPDDTMQSAIDVVPSPTATPREAELTTSIAVSEPTATVDAAVPTPTAQEPTPVVETPTPEQAGATATPSTDQPSIPGEALLELIAPKSSIPSYLTLVSERPLTIEEAEERLTRLVIVVIEFATPDGTRAAVESHRRDIAGAENTELTSAEIEQIGDYSVAEHGRISLEGEALQVALVGIQQQTIALYFAGMSPMHDPLSDVVDVARSTVEDETSR